MIPDRIHDIGEFRGIREDDVEIHMDVQKPGRTTGRTTGQCASQNKRNAGGGGSHRPGAGDGPAAAQAGTMDVTLCQGACATSLFSFHVLCT